MTDPEHWLSANDQYLATMLDWLRERLEHLAAPDTAAAMRAKDVSQSGQQPAKPAKSRLRDRLFRSSEISAPPPPALTAMRSDVQPAASAASKALLMPAPQIDEAAAEQPPALMVLAERLGLGEFERHTLLLCVAMELDTRMGALCAKAQQDPSRNYPTFALALTMFDQPAWDALSPERPLRFWRLIEINQPGAQPLITSALKADERIVNYVKGLNYLDDRLAPLVMPVARNDAALPPSQADVADVIVRQLQRLEGSGRLPVFQLLGSDSQSKLQIVQHALADAGLTLYRMNADALPTQAADHETFVRLWQRESALLPIGLYIDATQIERSGNPHASAIHRLFGRHPGVVFLDTRDAWPELGRDSISLDVAKPTPAEQHAVWTAALGLAGGDHPARLSGQFNLNVAEIRVLAADALAASASDPNALGAVLWKACVGQARPALDQLAHALQPKATWEDLELAAPEKALLRQVAAQVKARKAVYDDWGFRERMNRGLGITVLFAGESGTGKTMAAEVIANDLGLALYRIDLSAVVSKFIGETEKNLRRLFEAAEDSGAILFFDEADALFGKRSEVKDSHDRYANIEINYLLQRMESYRGLAILATNMKGSLDVAFMRRLRFIVNFAFPGPAERKAIWENAFPSKTPLAGIDYQRLAKLNVTGGSVHNIAINAAFLAAQAGSPVTMPIILDAARTEFRKLEKPIVNEADFRWLEPVETKA
jgi:hypothetical protein